MTASPSWAQPKTLAEWRDRVYRDLGGASYNVELDEPSLDHAIWRTLILFAKYRPDWQWIPLGLINGKQIFDWSQPLEVEGKVVTIEVGTKVKKVRFMKDAESYYNPSNRHIDHWFQRGIREPRRVYKHQVAADRYDFFLRTGPIWAWDEENRRLIVDSKSYNSVRGTAFVLQPPKVEKIPYHLETDFLDGAVAYSKQQLARILGKFGAIPAAQGDITTDAGTLRSEAKETLKDLEQKLDRNLRHLSPQPIW